MSILSEVKCARCDKKYSGLRSRCPYCGALRIGRGKYAEGADTSTGKMLAGIAMMTVLVIAVGVLLITAAEPPPESPPTQAVDTGTPSGLPGDSDNTSVTGDNTTPPPDTPPSIDDTQSSLPPSVESVTITYAGRKIEDFSEPIGKKIVLKVKIEPEGIDEEITWSSTNNSVFEVVPSEDGLSATVTIIGRGSARVLVKVGDKTAECWVRGKRP
jgi:DNA-directed RNA polymerase subunit RPC12/RpoP